MSKTERALEEPALLDAPGEGSLDETASEVADEPASDDVLDAKESLPAPSVGGFAPPTAPDSAAEANGNGHHDDVGGDTAVDEVEEGIAVDDAAGHLTDTSEPDAQTDVETDTDSDTGTGTGTGTDTETELVSDDGLGGDAEPLDPELARSIEGLFDDDVAGAEVIEEVIEEVIDEAPAPLPAPDVADADAAIATADADIADVDTDVAADASDVADDAAETSDAAAADIDAPDVADTDTDTAEGPPADRVVHDLQPLDEPPALDDSPALDEPPVADEPPTVVAIPGEALRVSPPGADVLEELRTAKVDGPTVEVAPQDDDSGYNVRRPHRLREYDPAPIPIPAKVPRLLGRKPRVRKVTRVVRHVDPWSVFKIAIVANLVLYVIMLVAGVLLWNVANATGTIDNVERFFESFGWSSFEFNGGEIYHSAWIAGLFLVVGLTGAAVLLATLFNLITDLVGGMRFTVLEEEVVETRTSPMRRFVVRRPEPEVPAIDRDDSGTIVREAVVDDSGAIVRRTR